MNSPADDPAKYWNFSFEEFGLDVVANSKAMHASSGTGKGYYIGYSQGTIQALVALAKYENELADYLNRVILFAPCTAQGDGSYTVDDTPASKRAGYVH